jgi:hypothetical protein
LKNYFCCRYGFKEKTGVHAISGQVSKEYENLIMGMIKLSEADRSEQSNFLLSCSLSSAIILLERGYSQFLSRDHKQKGFSFSSFALNFDWNFLKSFFFPVQGSRQFAVGKSILMNLAYAYSRLQDYRLSLYYGNQFILLGGKKR